MRPLVWFRADLRLRDNTALDRAARAASRGIVGVFVICPKQWQEHDWGDVKVDFILRTLAVLSRDLWKRKIPLLIETAETFADVPERLRELALKHACDAIYFNDEYEVNERARDREVARVFAAAGLGVRTFTDQVVVAPGAVRTNAGDFYSVFTPFRKSWIARVNEGGVPKPAPVPRAQPEAPVRPDDVPDAVDGYDRGGGRPDEWPAGEDEASRRLRSFVRSGSEEYAEARDRPDLDGTSRLSPYLTVGAISPRQCLRAAWSANGEALDGSSGAAVWISELIWREFYRHVLVGYPRVSRHRPFREETDGIAWRRSDRDFEAWCAGRTGIPIVDAGMRQLAGIGWMHNRLRMITAMFLTKHLLIDWRRGERHFMRHLVDGDLASNNGGWQWSASTGTDAAPYFRIFNPLTQSRRCDPTGAFIRRWVPELEGLDDKAIHDPSSSAPSLFDDLDYPAPIVDLDAGRTRALAAFKAL